jgi:hypothetical protein
MSWSPLKDQVLHELAPVGHELADFVELMSTVQDRDVPLIVAQIKSGRQRPDNDVSRRPTTGGHA